MKPTRPELRGVKTKIIGVVLIILGGLDSMLVWRAGIALDNFYLALLLAGVLLYALGAIRALPRPHKGSHHARPAALNPLSDPGNSIRPSPGGNQTHANAGHLP